MRDMLEISRQLDRWSYLGLPLLVSLTVPSAAGTDSRAWSKSLVATEQPATVHPQYQQEIVEKLIPLLLAKTAIHGVIWNQVFDSDPHPFPHGGLFDPENQSKPALATISEIRRDYLI